jgi:hypothetical protein
MLLAAGTGARAGGIAAQADSPDKAPSATLARLIANQSHIRVRLASGTTLELQRATIEGTMLVGRVATTARMAAYPIQDLSQVWRRGSAADLGLAVGAGIGFVGGAIGGVALASICIVTCGQTSGNDQLRGALVGGLVGSATVGALGLLFAIGAPAERWKSVYQAHQPRIAPIVTAHRVGVNLSF